MTPARALSDARPRTAPFPRWPSKAIYGAFYAYRTEYKLLAVSASRRGTITPAVQLGLFQQLCDRVIRDAVTSLFDRYPLQSAFGWHLSPDNSKLARRPSSVRLACQGALANLFTPATRTWFQSLASVLGGLAHLSVSHSGEVNNDRRTRRTMPTYPTEPTVLRRLSEDVLGPVCQGLGRLNASEESACLLDPSVESGQMLLDGALHILEFKYGDVDSLAASSALVRENAGRWLTTTLTGVDRNARCLVATRSLLRLLAWRFRLPGYRLGTLHHGDAYSWLTRGTARCTVLLNNPPWGASVPEWVVRRMTRRGFSGAVARDSATVFSVLGLDRLQTFGRYGLILPAPLLAGEKGAQVRMYLAEHTRLESIEWLPTESFAPATLRGVSVTGSLGGPVRFVRIVYGGENHRRRVARVRPFALTRPESCWHAPRRGIPGWSCPVVPLGELATIHTCTQLYARGRGSQPQGPETLRTRPFSSRTFKSGFCPAARGRDVTPFLLRTPQLWVNWGPWLAYPGPSPYDSASSARLFLRELVRRDGSVSAAVVREPIVATSGVVVITPHSINADVLCAFLCSRLLATHIRDTSAAFAKVDFQRLTITELRRLPVPMALRSGESWSKLLRRRLAMHARYLANCQDAQRRNARLQALDSVLDDFSSWGL